MKQARFAAWASDEAELGAEVGEPPRSSPPNPKLRDGRRAFALAETSAMADSPMRLMDVWSCLAVGPEKALRFWLLCLPNVKRRLICRHHYVHP